MAIITRAGKGAPLTHDEMDANWTQLNAAIVALEALHGPGTWELIDSKDGAGLQLVDFLEGFDGSFSRLRLEYDNFGPFSAAADLWLQVWQGAAVRSGLSDYEWVRNVLRVSSGTNLVVVDADDSKIVLTLEPATQGAIFGEIDFLLPTLTTKRGFKWSSWEIDPVGSDQSILTTGAGRFKGNNSAIDGIRLIAGSNVIEHGVFSLYGKRV